MKIKGENIMYKIRYVVSVMLICVIFANYSLPLASANITKNAIDYLNLAEYTMEELRTVTPDEWSAYLEAYRQEKGIIDTEISLLWASGDENNLKTHEFAALWALILVGGDKDVWNSTLDDFLDDAAILSIAAGKPDKHTVIFVGHFYDPGTGKNYLGGTSPTAKTWAESHYNKAVANQKNGKHADALDELGRALHFVQDASEPHHASNITGLNPAHGAFEDYCYEQSSYITETSCSNATYDRALRQSIGDYTHFCASVAKSYSWMVDNNQDRSRWNSAAENCLKTTTANSAGCIYKFAKETELI